MQRFAFDPYTVAHAIGSGAIKDNDAERVAAALILTATDAFGVDLTVDELIDTLHRLHRRGLLPEHSLLEWS